MSNLIPGNQKHLTLEDRLYIEKALSNGTSFKDIALLPLQRSNHYLQGGEETPSMRLVSQRLFL